MNLCSVSLTSSRWISPYTEVMEAFSIWKMVPSNIPGSICMWGVNEEVGFKSNRTLIVHLI